MGIKLRTNDDNNANLVANWPMKEGTGSSIADLSGNGNTGTITGATWVKTTGGDSCLSFDGTDDYVDCGNNASLSMGTGDHTATS